MALINDREGMLYQNLTDAKCSGEMIQECMAFAAKGRFGMIMTRLKEQRKDLLDTIHEHQKALDCLDYLMFQMEKQK